MFSSLLFSQNDSLRKHEIGIIYQQSWHTGVWSEVGQTDDFSYGYMHWLIHYRGEYSNSIGIRYKFKSRVKKLNSNKQQ
jgi:hypothetical protein